MLTDGGAVEKAEIYGLRLLRYARNDVKTHFLSLRGAQRRSNLDFFNSSMDTVDTEFRQGNCIPAKVYCEKIFN
jgi:hypothetical protein